MIIEYIEGRVISLDKDGIVLITVSGIGYRIQGYFENSLKISNECAVWVDFRMSQDSMKLYGFLKSSSLKLFRALILVQGVSSRMAQQILNFFDEETIVYAISHEKKDLFKKIPGVGLKIAERIIKEVRLPQQLCEGIKTEDINLSLSLKNDVRQALMNLGYTHECIEKTLKFIPLQLSLETYIVESLKYITHIQN